MELLKPVVLALQPMTQIELAGVAHKSGVSITTINAVRRGVTRNPGVSTFADIAGACGYELRLVSQMKVDGVSSAKVPK